MKSNTFGNTNNKKRNNAILDKIQILRPNISQDIFQNQAIKSRVDFKDSNYEILNSSNLNNNINENLKEKNEKNKRKTDYRRINSSNLRNRKILEKNNSADQQILQNNKVEPKSNMSSFMSNYYTHDKNKLKLSSGEKSPKQCLNLFPYNLIGFKKKKSVKEQINEVLEPIIQSNKAKKSDLKLNKYSNFLSQKLKFKLSEVNNNNTNINNSKIFHSSKTARNYFSKYSSNLEKKNENKVLDRKIKIGTRNKSNNNLNKRSTNMNSSQNDNISFSKSLSKEDNDNIIKLSQKIKDEVKLYFIKNKFASIKDYFKDWFYNNKNDGHQNKLFLGIDDIYHYLKSKINMKVTKYEIQKIFGCNYINLDVESFKNFFFEENSGKKCFLVINNFLLSKNNFSDENIFNIEKDNYLPKSVDHLKICENLNKNYDLIFNLLKEQKEKILEKLGNMKNMKNMECEYYDFYYLIKSLNLDKKICHPEIIRKLFVRYQNKNEKINVMKFIYDLFEDSLSIKNIKINPIDIIYNLNHQNAEKTHNKEYTKLLKETSILKSIRANFVYINDFPDAKNKEEKIPLNNKIKTFTSKIKIKKWDVDNVMNYLKYYKISKHSEPEKFLKNDINKDKELLILSKKDKELLQCIIKFNIKNKRKNFPSQTSKNHNTSNFFYSHNRPANKGSNKIIEDNQTVVKTCNEENDIKSERGGCTEDIREKTTRESINCQNENKNNLIKKNLSLHNKMRLYANENNFFGLVKFPMLNYPEESKNLNLNSDIIDLL